MNNLLNKRLIIFTGKGGVGKTSLAIITALAALKRGKKVLLCELSSSEKISSLLGYEKTNHKIKNVENNLFLVNIDFHEAMKEYGLMILKSKLLYKATFENRIVKKFLTGIPGLKEMVLTGKIRYHESELNDDKSYKYDLIIIDAPATGHGVSFLELPNSVLNVINTGIMAKELKITRELFMNKEKTSISVITIPEELPVNESKQLLNILKNTLKMPSNLLFVNQVIDKLLNTRQKNIYNDLKKIDNNEIKKLINAGEYRASREKLNQKYLDVLEKMDIEKIYLPYLFKEKLTRKDFDYLADVLLSQLK